MRSAKNLLFYLACYILLISQISACSSQKETATSRGMQNLTARYNILYNAREILNESEFNIKAAYQDDFDVLISAYQEPSELLSQPELKKLDGVILKANAIVNDKSQSKYVDDAYFLIAKANFLKSNFYNAVEFFDYVFKSYPKQPELRQAALYYKARSLINAERFTEAEATLDSAFKYIDTEKKSVADIYATAAQLAIYGRQDAQAADLLGKALQHAKKDQNQIRWTYLLAQLQQITGKTEAALSNYTRIIKSNAPFEMAFNATLNRLSIRDEQSGRTVDRAEQIRSLLDDENNLDFTDQVYYKIAKIYAENEDWNQAIANYNTSISKSTRNENQKGLSYLALADIYFKQADYAKSKLYYDSTLISLSTQYRDYELIRKKANSLEILANRLSLIAREDTLQMLAALPEADREQRIGILVRKQAQQAINPAGTQNLPAANNSALQPASNNSVSADFYFNNPIALSQGLTDFKRVWGNRKLEDNWRRSQRSAADLANAGADPDEFGIPDNPDEVASSPIDQAAVLPNLIPVTPEMLAASNERILNAYYDIGNFYREVLNDEAEAIKTYELMLSRFPDSDLKLPLYYNLYRLYEKSDPQRSLNFKNIILNQFPESAFAKVIVKPGYNLQNNEQETEVLNLYNKIYDQFSENNHTAVLDMTEQARHLYPDNKLAPQISYLNALALGYTQKLPVLDSAFRQIINSFPDDQLIVPLVRSHLQFIDSNRVSMGNRSFALMEQNPNEPRFVIEEPVKRQVKASTSTMTVTPQTVKNIPVLPAGTENAPPQTAEAATVGNSLFTLTDSAEYYFVVNVTDPALNLSSSRFGIGQFNRANFAGEGIRHQLKQVNNQNQLIFTGAFLSRGRAAAYVADINPLIAQIMKIPVGKYNTFYISKENLDKLTDRGLIDQYIQFYQQNLEGTSN